ncbi:Uncharacterised protein [Streptococcus pneumoniae]|nr:Uncharacterised protein [Streptococcus pneumoniae]COS25960.1 Uncharacterised protein [Streptococcus pneumoniae]
MIPPINPESPEMANIPPTKPAANPGLSAILRAMKPANTGMINAKALFLPIFHSCSAKALCSALLGSNELGPIMNTIAIKIPPAITSGNILETPFIKCL